MKLLDLFCGVGGWSKCFHARGWECVGVDVARLGYPFQFLQCSVLDLSPDFINRFDAVVASPPCEEFARAWLPWLRFDKQPSHAALDLLSWSIGLCDRSRRIVECSKFAARHFPGSVVVGSYAFWGDVPLLMPRVTGKEKKSGLNPALRAEIPAQLSSWVATVFGGAK